MSNFIFRIVHCYRTNGTKILYNLTIGHLSAPPPPLIDSRFFFAGKILIIHFHRMAYQLSLERAALIKAKRISRVRLENIYACAFVPPSFRNRSGSTFRVYRPCDFRWTGNLNRPFVQSSTCTQSARDCMLGGRMMARLTYLRIDRRDLLFASFRRTFYSSYCSACCTAAIAEEEVQLHP